MAYKYLNDHQLVQKLFDEIAPRFSDRPGGYTRLVKSRIRFVDQAPMTFVRFVTDEISAPVENETADETVQDTTIEEQVKAGVNEELEAAADVAETVSDAPETEVVDEAKADEADADK